MNKSFEKIDIVFVHGKNEGNGHFLRMSMLAEKIKQNRPHVKIGMHNFNDQAYLTGADVLLCDIRDKELDKKITKLYKLIVFLDSRNENKSKEYFYIDTLPHYNMTVHEYKNALRYFLTDISLVSKNLKNRKAGKVFAEKRKFFFDRVIAKNATKTLVQLPLSFKNKRLYRETFLKKLQKSEKFVGYFGQSMLEALLLQKDIVLYPVSKYHAQLSQSFARRWNASNMNLLHLDNKGAERLLFFMDKLFRENIIK